MCFDDAGVPGVFDVAKETNGKGTESGGDDGGVDGGNHLGGDVGSDYVVIRPRAPRRRIGSICASSKNRHHNNRI